MVEVGTPPQNFNVVPDSGSNSVIVPSCLCVEEHHCQKKVPCFRGGNVSETFHLPEYDDKIAVQRLSYGSGDVEAVLAQDVLKVGNAKTFMKDGILLITNQNLKIDNFGGILGLGVPPNSSNAPKPAAVVFEAGGVVRQPRSFLEQYGVERFSICFTSDSGSLRLGVPPLKDPLPSIGFEHWNLEFRGVSVGENKLAQVSKTCDPSEKKDDLLTACSALPDSGTSAIVGPQKDIEPLLESICDGWKRCKNNHTKLQEAADAAEKAAADVYGVSPWKFEVASKAELLGLLLTDCDSWLKEEGATIDELPPLHFEVAGAHGKRQKVTISSHSYIAEMVQEEAVPIFHKIPGLGKVPVGMKGTGQTRNVCVPLLSPMNFGSRETGHSWILGVPLFLEYSVGYDLKERSISLTPLTGNSSCGACADSDVAFVNRETQVGKDDLPESRKRLRKLSGPLRLPDFP
eukprot:TRINITY_DN65886_c0_g1_i1.p1 TRINITY_DN65886_c0_g1~~TRINITY_DN65886_c0_g1_i1.p1  ORF type:complete len:539 (-),score=68.40 TRINITY_DN65886_c0_g1_i1:71-1447(-)